MKTGSVCRPRRSVFDHGVSISPQLQHYLISRFRSAVEVTAGAALSVTVKVNFVFGKVAVGLPLMAPVPASNLRPAGNAGVTDHFSAGVPPVASMVVAG